MSRARRIAERLLDVLQEYADVLDVYEDHFWAVVAKEFSKDGEKESLAAMQECYQLPMMVQCRDAGFTYADLMLILPGAFKTTYEERRRVLEDLTQFAGEKYGAR